jgi:tape measure domain-containing protein
MAKKQLNIILGVDVGALERSLKGVERRLQRFASNIQSIGRELTTSVTVPLAGLGAASLKAFGDIEKLEKGMQAIVGPTGDASKELARLRTIAEQPGLAFEQAVKGSIQLQAVGFSADAAAQSLDGLAKVVAVTGGTADNLDAVVRQLTQINSKGRILAEDLLVIQENAPAIGLALEKAFGTQNAEGIRELGISTGEFSQRLIEAIPQVETFQNVTGGVANAFDNFRNNVKFALAELGRSINEVINIEAIFQKVNAALNNAVEFFKSLTPEARKFVVVTAAIVAGIGPVLLLIGKFVALGGAMASTLKLLVQTAGNLGGAFAFLTSPIGLTIAAIVGAVAAMTALYNSSENTRRSLNGLTDFLIELYKVIRDIAKPIADIAIGLTKAFNRDYAGAAASLSAAFNAEVPSITEVGVRLGTAFAGGFNDTSNRLADGIESLKARIFSTTKEVQQELASTFPTGGGFPGGGSTGGAAIADADFVVPEPDIDFDLSEKLTIDEAAVISPLQKYILAIDRATQSAELFGATGGDLLNEKLNITRQSIQDLLSNGYSPQSAAIQDLIAQYGALSQELAALIEEQEIQEERLKEVQKIVGTIGAGLDSFFTALIDGSKDAFGSFVDGFKKAIADLLKRLAIVLIQAVAVAAVLSLIFPGTAAGGSKFTANLKNVLGTLGKGIPGLASGGIVPPGYPNDTFPARLTSGEAVIPLDKLDQMGGGGNVFIPNLTIKGQDFVIAFEKAKASYNRIS